MKNNYIINHILTDIDDDTRLNVDDTIQIDKRISVYSTELEYEKIKIKFNKSLLKYLKNLKDDQDDYHIHVCETFFNLWKKIAIEGNNITLFNLLKYLTKQDAYNIKKTIFDMVTHEYLKDKLYLKFINDFIKMFK